MALLRRLPFPPSIPQFSSEQFLISPTTNSLLPSPSSSLSFYTFCTSTSTPLSSPRILRTQITTHFLLRTTCSIQLPHAAAIQSTPELVTSIEDDEDDEKPSKIRLLAQNVPWDCTATDIRPLFEKYGTVVDVELSMYNKTRNRGLAFITMGSHEEALAAFNNLENYEYEGRVLKLAWAKPRKKKVSPPPRVQTKPLPVHNLFVANLPFQARAKDLKEFFNAENANVASAEIIFHENPRGSAGYGFVSFYTKHEADAALSNFQGKNFMGRPIRVAPSRTFLRQESKASVVQSENVSDKLNPSTQQTESTPNEV